MKQRLINAIAGSLSGVSRDDIVERSVAHFTKADPDDGARTAARVAELRALPYAEPQDGPAAIVVPSPLQTVWSTTAPASVVSSSAASEQVD